MWFLSSRKSQSATPVRRVSFRPRLEALEGRCVPSSGPFDPTFGSGGVVTTDFNGGNDYGNALVLQPDARILVAGQVAASSGTQFGLARYTLGGTLDQTFGSGGKSAAKVSGYAQAAALYANTGTGNDGKVVLAGWVQTSPKTTNGLAFELARYNANGSLDTSFGNKGTLTTGNGPHTAQAVLIQPDGKIVAAGTATDPSVPGSNHFEFTLVRYNVNGTLDATFGSGGKVTTQLGKDDSEILGATLQADGKIVVAGYSRDSSGFIEFTLGRYNTNGTTDMAFGQNGFTFFSVNAVSSGGTYGARCVALQADGKIVAAGGAQYNDSVLARFNSNGSLDSTFNSTGIVRGANLGSLDAEAIQPDGKIVVTNGSSITRYSSDGGLDTTFDGTGAATSPIGIAGLAIQPLDGRIVAAGSAMGSKNQDFAGARFLANGPVIGSFTVSPNPVTSGSTSTLTVSNITDPNPSANITQVAIYLDSNGDGRLESSIDTLVGYATQTSPGVWTINYTVNLAPGSYTLFAQAQDNYNLIGDPFAVAFQVM